MYCFLEHRVSIISTFEPRAPCIERAICRRVSLSVDMRLRRARSSQCLDRWFDSHLEFYFLETPTPLLLFEKQTVFCFCCLLFCVRSPARPFCRSILILLPARNPGSKISLKNVGFSFYSPERFELTSRHN